MIGRPRPSAKPASGKTATSRIASAASPCPVGMGKSYAGAVVGLWRLLCGPRGHEIAPVALDYEGAKGVLAHAKALVRQHPVLAREVEPSANGLSVPGRHSRWTLVSSDHSSSSGQHPDVAL